MAVAGCRKSQDSAQPYRFTDALPAEQWAEWAIGDVSRPVLPALQARTRLPIPDGGGPLLDFATGLEQPDAPATVRFEVLFEGADGQQTALFQKDVVEPGWTVEHLDLAGHNLRGASLIFQRSVVSGPGEALFHSAWGNPRLLHRESPTRPSVILISLDTLRADFVGAYGNTSVRTPGLDRLARGGVVYEQAYSPSTWTVPSHTALFYGLHLAQSPALLRSQGLLPPDSPIVSRPLAEVLRRAGFLTAGFTGGGFMFHPFDLPRGFEVYTGFFHPVGKGGECLPERFDGAQVFERGQRWLRGNADRPFFLFLHTYDVHDRCPFFGDKNPFESAGELTPERRLALVNYYRQLIEEVDRKIVALLDLLAEQKLLDSTLVVLTSDHGEAYWEHGVHGHNCDMKPYEEVSRVPLILHWPARIPAGQRIATPVSLIDVAPTILALFGLPAEEWMRGMPLPGLDLAGARTGEQPVFVHCGDALAVRSGTHKLITSREGRYPDELYDLARDPRERTGLAGTDPARARLQLHAAGYWQSAVRDSTPKPDELDKLDPAAKERLRALGYLE